MWEQITHGDIERAKTELNRKRAETLRRHAEEIAGLDAQLQDIERFEGIVAAFFDEYMTAENASAVEKDKPPRAAAPGEQSNAPPLDLQIRDQVSPNFAIPPRLRTSAG
jgi:hypothetical protein